MGRVGVTRIAKATAATLLLFTSTAGVPADSPHISAVPLEEGLIPEMGAMFEVICSACTEYRVYQDEELIIQRHRFPNGYSTEGCTANLFDDANEPVAAHGPYHSDDGHAHVELMLDEDEEMGCRSCGGSSQCHTTYQNGPCHVACGQGGGGTIDDIVAAIGGEDADLLGQLVLANPQQVVLNRARRAVQVLDCQGIVEGHFPLSKSLFERSTLIATAR